MRKILLWLFTKENLWALLLCLIVVAVIMASSGSQDKSWFIYQTF
jgi:hypothetical protein